MEEENYVRVEDGFGYTIWIPMEQKTLIGLYSAFLTPENVLDVGCGGGRLLKFFPGSYVGIDKSRRNIKSNILVGKNRILADANFLPFRDMVFDMVFSCTVLMLNKDVKQIVSEMERVSYKYLLFLESRTKFISRRDLETRTSKGRSPLSLWLFAR